jgi:hypothetical protein
MEMNAIYSDSQTHLACSLEAAVRLASGTFTLDSFIFNTPL